MLNVQQLRIYFILYFIYYKVGPTPTPNTLQLCKLFQADIQFVYSSNDDDDGCGGGGGDAIAQRIRLMAYFL